MPDKYILEGKKPIPCHNPYNWALWFEQNDKSVCLDWVGDSMISTVFLGVDHQYGNGPPLLFETWVKGGDLHGEMERYTTWEQAQQGHRDMLARVRRAKLRLVKT